MRFFVQLIIMFDLILLSAIFFLRNNPFVAENKVFLIFSVLVLTALTMVAYSFIYRGMHNQSNADFFRLFGIGIGVKFAATLAYVVFYISVIGLASKNAILPVALAYSGYNMLIIWASMKQLGHKTKPNEDGSPSTNPPEPEE